MTQELLSLIEFTINTTRALTGDKRAPFERLMGFMPRSSGDPAEPSPQRLVSFEALRDERADKQLMATRRSDQNRLTHQVLVESVVMIPRESALVDYNKHGDSTLEKARDNWSGPFTVSKVTNRGNVTVDLGDGFGSVTVHASKVKVVPRAMLNVPWHQDQPDRLTWPSGERKASIAVGKRQLRGATQYLLKYWGCHDVQAKWIFSNDVQRSERGLLTDYDERVKAGKPSILGCKRGKEKGLAGVC